MITAVPKFKISLLKNIGFARVTHSDTRPYFTVQSGRQNCFVTGYKYFKNYTKNTKAKYKKSKSPFN